MSFYDPLAPVFDATRLEIERTIMGLEERLMRRKQLDLQMQKDLIDHQSLQKLRHHQRLYDPLDRVNSAQVELQKRLRNLRTFNPREDYAQRQNLQLDYITRLRYIQREQLALSQEYKYNQHAGSQNTYLPLQQNYNGSGEYHPFDESGQMLARKYFDGTRAYEYNAELKGSGDNFNKVDNFSKDKNPQRFNQTIQTRGYQQKEPDHSTVKKYQSSPKPSNDQQYQSYQKTFNNSRQSPIKQIENSAKFNSTAGKIVNLNHQKQKFTSQKHNKSNEKHQEFYSNDHSPQLESKHIQRSRTKSTQPTNQLINIPEGAYSRQSQSRSRPKSSTKASHYLSNRQKSSHSLHYHSATKSNLPILAEQLPIEQKFKIWFRERMRLAEEAKQIYEIKYAKNLPDYLMTVCEKEDKLRKDLKEKICRIPAVERKYDVGPVNQ